MQHFLSAIQFITVIPIPRCRVFEPSKMAIYFPLVGLLLGASLALFDFLALKFFSYQAAAALDIVVLIILTRGFHLDGLADTADGLLSHRPRRETLAIMKDSRIGVMGVLAIVSVLAIKWAGIQSLDSWRFLILILVPAYSRSAMLIGIKFMAYAREEGGLGKEFLSQKKSFLSLWGVYLLITLSLILGWQAISLNLCFIIGTIIILYYYQRRLGGITGDTLGALCEGLEAFLFLILAFA